MQSRYQILSKSLPGSIGMQSGCHYIRTTQTFTKAFLCLSRQRRTGVLSIVELKKSQPFSHEYKNVSKITDRKVGYFNLMAYYMALEMHHLFC